MYTCRVLWQKYNSFYWLLITTFLSSLLFVSVHYHGRDHWYSAPANHSISRVDDFSGATACCCYRRDTCCSHLPNNQL